MTSLHIHDFAWALYQLKNGDRVCRAGWNGKGQFVEMQTPDAGSKMGRPYAYLSDTEGRLVPWTPSQGDLFADDWGPAAVQPAFDKHGQVCASGVVPGQA